MQKPLTEHDIDVGDARRISQRFHCVKKKKYLDAEVKYVFNNGIAVPSSSSWASPSILVPRPDNTARFCTNF